MTTVNNEIYDIAGIGIGPFNLGLAALSDPVRDLKTIFFDQSREFEWHGGMMMDYTTLQVPFLADLVTMADPCSRYSFLNYLKQTDRIYKFYIRENFFILRKEYNLYCKWVAAQLPQCRFGHSVKEVSYISERGLYRIAVNDLAANREQVYYSRKLVLGTGTQPYTPECVRKIKFEGIIHSSEYLNHKQRLLQTGAVTVVGSGQSAAEIFYDLLQHTGESQDLRLSWYTRSDRFFPMEYSKLTLELTSPEYVSHFYALPQEKKDRVLHAQNNLYKGIDYDLINAIYDLMYEKSVGNKILPVKLCTNCDLKGLSVNRRGSIDLSFTHTQTGQPQEHETEAVVLATGYKYHQPSFIEPILERIAFDDKGRYEVKKNYAIDHLGNEVFVQNAELHTHGFVTPDLGMGAYRNTIILNEILGFQHFREEQRIAFQSFGSHREHSTMEKREALEYLL